MKQAVVTTTTKRIRFTRLCNLGFNSRRLMRVVRFRAASVSFAAFVIFLAACDKSDEQIKVYRVAKAPLESSASEEGAMPTNAASPAFPAGVAPVTTTPPNWEPQPLSQMRHA